MENRFSIWLYFILQGGLFIWICADDFRIPQGVAEALIGLIVAVVTAVVASISENEDI